MALCNSLTPDFISYLFSSKPKFDCYFKVGNKTQGNQERIGAVKLMLMAHSEVFRAELEYEKSDVSVEDVHPDIFRGLLRYVYGNDTTADMDFDDADNLLYVAEKYMVKTLKDKLATRLMKLLNTDNICSLLNNPACRRHLELDSAITDILRNETDRVLASPQFVSMNADGFLRILEQDGVAVEEIELWRAAIRWAKHRANSEDGRWLRQQLSGLTRHLRPCALTVNQICGEIADTQVLTREEIGTVCLSVCRKEKPRDLGDFSCETKPRKILGRQRNTKHVLLLAKLNNKCLPTCDSYTFILHTKRNSIELLPLSCRAEIGYSGVPSTFRVNCTTTVTKVVNPHDEPPVVMTFSENVRCGAEFEIPLTANGNNIILQPDTEYRVQIMLCGLLILHDRCSGSYEYDHLTLDLPFISFMGRNIYNFPCIKLEYRVHSTAE